MNYFKKANGTMIFGVSIMIISCLFIVYFINITSMRHYKQLSQLAADSMSDSIAIHMQTGGKTYEDACDEAKHLKPLLEKSLGVKINKVQIDKEAFKHDSAIKVILTTKTHSPVGINKKTKKAYQLITHSTTVFQLGGLRNFPAVLKWAESNINWTSYSQGNRTAVSSDGRIASTDCSGFVWFCYKKMGLSDSVPIWYTGSMDDYFDRIDPSEARPGDVMFCTASERGGDCGHARLFVGDTPKGNIIECTSGTHTAKGNGVQYKTVDLNNLGPYHFGRIKPQYMK